MADIYDNFNIMADKLLDSRCCVYTLDDLCAIPHKCEGLTCWVIELEMLFVYREKSQCWIPLFLTVPYEVKEPRNGSIKIDAERKMLLFYHDGVWYDGLGRDFDPDGDYFYHHSTFDKVVDKDTGETLEQTLKSINYKLDKIINGE